MLHRPWNTATRAPGPLNWDSFNAFAVECIEGASVGRFSGRVRYHWLMALASPLSVSDKAKGVVMDWRSKSAKQWADKTPSPEALFGLGLRDRRRRSSTGAGVNGARCAREPLPLNIIF